MHSPLLIPPSFLSVSLSPPALSYVLLVLLPISFLPCEISLLGCLSLASVREEPLALLRPAPPSRPIHPSRSGNRCVQSQVLSSCPAHHLFQYTYTLFGRGTFRPISPVGSRRGSLSSRNQASPPAASHLFLHPDRQSICIASKAHLTGVFRQEESSQNGLLFFEGTRLSASACFTLTRLLIYGTEYRYLELWLRTGSLRGQPPWSLFRGLRSLVAFHHGLPCVTRRP